MAVTSGHITKFVLFGVLHASESEPDERDRGRAEQRWKDRPEKKEASAHLFGDGSLQKKFSRAKRRRRRPLIITLDFSEIVSNDVRGDIKEGILLVRKGSEIAANKRARSLIKDGGMIFFSLLI